MTCTGSSGSCNSHSSLATTDTETGTYSVAGTVITLVNSADGSSLEQSYCVQGNTLHILDVDARVRKLTDRGYRTTKAAGKPT